MTDTPRPKRRHGRLPDDFDALMDIVAELTEQEEAITAQLEDASRKPETEERTAWRKRAQHARMHIAVRRQRATSKMTSVYRAASMGECRTLSNDYRRAIKAEKAKARHLARRAEAQMAAAKMVVSRHAPALLEALHQEMSDAADRYDAEHSHTAEPPAETLGKALPERRPASADIGETAA